MSKVVSKQPTEYIIEPVVTEKATELQNYNIYTFWVHPQANKVLIKQAIKKMYNVQPEKIRIINLKGKTVRYGRSVGRTKKRKKALVYIPKTQKIDFYKG
ncbi:50S ribosomal protein L23 [bacterium]|nr:50S ribosomal protein L23 [bacterium]